MLKVIIIEDDQPTSNAIKSWIEKARSQVHVEQYYTREEAVEAITRNTYDIIILDIELGAEKNAGVNIIMHAGRKSQSTPVLVVSGHPAEVYRGVMKAADAWDYLQKPVQPHDFIETFLEIVRECHKSIQPTQNKVDGLLQLDPLRQVQPSWNNKRLIMPLAAQRILSLLYTRRNTENPTVSFTEFFEIVKSGKNKENIRRQIAIIKAAIRDVDPDFDSIIAEPMRGYRWVNR